MMRDYLILDASKYPLVLGTFQEFFPTVEEFQKWQTDVEAFNANKENYVIVLDFSKVQTLPLEYRIMAAKWAAKHDEFFLTRNIKTIFCTPSLSQRVMMKAILIMLRPKATYMLVSNLDKGCAWAKRELALFFEKPNGLTH